MRPAACGVLLLAAALGGCATIGPPADGRPVLEAVRFEGNEHLSSKDLIARIATTPSSGFLFFRHTLRTWDADLFEIDRQRLLRFYRQRGFFEATIGEPRVETDAGGRVSVTVAIKEARRAKVVRVLLEGLDKLADAQRAALPGKLPLKAGDDFDEDLYEKSKLVLQQLLKEASYASAEVSGEVRVALDEALATVVLTCDTGRAFKLGKVIVSGNRAIAAALISGATGLERGQDFAPSRLDLAQQRVYNLGVFSGVRVGLEPLGEDPVAAVRVSVREAPFQTVRAGVGLQLEQSRLEIPRLRLEYANRSLFGGVRRLELATQVGYAFTPSITAPEKTGLVTQSSAQVTLPQALFGLDFVGRGEFARELQVGFNYNQISARAALLWRQGKLSVAGSFNFVRTFDATLDLDLSSLIGKGGAAAAALSNCVPACSLPYPEVRVTVDARDEVVEPRAGFYASASLARTLPGLTFDYWRIDPEIRFYAPLGTTVTLAARAQWGALIQPPGASALATPFNQRFFGGGQTQNRGYAAQAQGPRLGAQPTAEGYATDSVPIGGNGMVIASLELRIQTDFLLNSSRIVPFLDASRVSDSWELPFTQMLEFSPGLGLRYLTPLGPLRFDVAFVVNPQDLLAQAPRSDMIPTPVSSSCDSSTLRCLHLSRFAYHLTLGEAF